MSETRDNPRQPEKEHQNQATKNENPITLETVLTAIKDHHTETAQLHKNVFDEIKQLRQELKAKDDRITALETEVGELSNMKNEVES